MIILLLFSQVRRQMEELLAKNGELSRANTELRHKVTDLEYECKDQRQKMASQKSQVEHLTRVRQKQDESLHSMQVSCLPSHDHACL